MKKKERETAPTHAPAAARSPLTKQRVSGHGPPMESLNIISRSRNKLLAALPSPRTYGAPKPLAMFHPESTGRQNAAGRKGSNRENLLETPKNGNKAERRVETSIHAKKHIVYPQVTIRSGADSAFYVAPDTAVVSKSSIPLHAAAVGGANERPCSVHIVKQRSVTKGKEQPEGDDVEQGIIQGNPSVQQETGQRFYSEESDKCQIITELSDYVCGDVPGEMRANDNGPGPDPERLNTEQINEGVTYANGGVGIRARGYCSKYDYNSARAKCSTDIDPNTKYGRYFPGPLRLAESASMKQLPGSRRPSTKRILLRDLGKLQEEIMERQQRLQYATQHEDDNMVMGSILDEGSGEDVEAGAHSYYTPRLQRRNFNFGQRATANPKPERTRHLHFLTKRNKQKKETAKISLNTERDETERTGTNEDMPQLKYTNAIIMERNLPHEPVLLSVAEIVIGTLLLQQWQRRVVDVRCAVARLNLNIDI